MGFSEQNQDIHSTFFGENDFQPFSREQLKSLLKKRGSDNEFGKEGGQSRKFMKAIPYETPKKFSQNVKGKRGEFVTDFFFENNRGEENYQELREGNSGNYSGHKETSLERRYYRKNSYSHLQDPLSPNSNQPHQTENQNRANLKRINGWDQNFQTKQDKAKKRVKLLRKAHKFKIQTLERLFFPFSNSCSGFYNSKRQVKYFNLLNYLPKLRK